MEVFSALYATAAVLLILAGGAKGFRPAATQQLLKDLGVPSWPVMTHRRLVLGLGVVEVALGVAGLVSKISAVAVVTGAVYVAFAGVVTLALRSGSASCGCFGRPDTPPTTAHVVVNLALGAAALVAATTKAPLEVMAAQPVGGLGFVAVVGAAAGGLFVVLGGRVGSA